MLWGIAIGLEAVGPPLVHAGPEILGVVGVEPGEGDVRRLGAAEDDVAVEVLVDASGAGGRVLVGDEGREHAGLVVAVRRGRDLAPGGTHDILVEVLANARIGVLHVAHVGLHGAEDPPPLLHGLGRAHGFARRVVVSR